MSKDPVLASILNLLLLGAGHIYLRQMVKGLLIFTVGFGLGVFIWPATILVVIWSMYDAYKTAQRMNQTAR